MIPWSEISISWSGVDVIHSMTHIPTNTTIVVDVVDAGQREAIREQLDAAVKALP